VGKRSIRNRQSRTARSSDTGQSGMMTGISWVQGIVARCRYIAKDISTREIGLKFVSSRESRRAKMQQSSRGRGEVTEGSI
jgi:hypothetical protein